MVFNKIIQNEWRNLVRSKVLLWLLGFMVVLSLFVIWQTTVKFKKAYEGRMKAASHMRDKFIGQGAVNPHSAAHYGHFVYKPMNVLNVIDEGVNPFTGVSLRLEAHKQNEVLFSPSQSSSSIIRFGELRLSLVLQVLFPLFILFACYNSMSREREQGILKLAITQGVSLRKLIWGKTIAYSLIWWALLTLNVMVLWALIRNISVHLSVERLFFVLMAYALYFFIVTALSVYVSAMSARPGNALLLLLAGWLFTSILLPKATANIGDHLTPLLARLELEKRIKEDNKNGINGHDPRNERTKRFMDSVLKSYGEDTVSKLSINVDGLTMQADEEYHNMVYDRHFGQIQQTIQEQNGITSKSSWINPFAAVRNLSMGMAATDVYHHLNFIAQAEHYRRFLIRKMNMEMAYGGSKTGDWEWAVSPDYWQGIHDFEYQQPAVSWALQNNKREALALISWLLLTSLLIHFTSNRIRVL